MKTIYLSGAISNNPDYRKDFAEAEGYVEHLQAPIAIVNPANFPPMEKWTWADWLLFDLRVLRDCDALLLLPRSFGSWGCLIEQYFARGMGIPILDMSEVRIWADELRRTQS
jgi:hypothetical protein